LNASAAMAVESFMPSQEDLLQRIAKLEFELKRREQQLVAERERSSRARRKARQLYAKLLERDEMLGEMRALLETMRDHSRLSHAVAAGASAQVLAAAGEVPIRQLSAGTLRKHNTLIEQSKPVRPSSAPGSHRSSQKQSATGRASASNSRIAAQQTRLDLLGSTASGDQSAAVQQRFEIVAQLEEHLAQMRVHLAATQRELGEFEQHKLERETEWSRSAAEGGMNSDNEGLQAHRQALAMIAHQVDEKRRFARQLTRKAQQLEKQIVKQRALLGDLHQHDDGFVSDSPEVSEGSELAVEPVWAEEPKANGGNHGPTVDAACKNEALTAFLAAAGPAGDVINNRPPLRAAFEANPPELSAGAIEGCGPEERQQALSLFFAWVAVAASSPHAMRMCDIGLTLADASELEGVLQACGAQLEEWEMTRCPANDATVRVIFKTLATQPLACLNLSYNTLGPSGASQLVSVTPAWTQSLERLILEMNGLGDKGCTEVAKVLAAGTLPQLKTLELGWNELSPVSAPVLAKLLMPRRADGLTVAGACSLPRLQKLGLGGNSLGSQGAQTLLLAALTFPSRPLDLDLSMNHVGAQPLAALVEWAESHDRSSTDLRISVSLEWNLISDTKAVQRLARTFAAYSRIGSGSTDGAQAVFLRLANNELNDLEPAEVLMHSRGLVSC